MLVPDTHRELRPGLGADLQTGQRVAGLPEIPFGWTEEAFHLRDQSFRLWVPFRPDSLLDSPEVLSANIQDDYMPYWAYLWPAALQIAESVLQSHWPKNTRVLELGCGLGLVGIAALAAGYCVSLTDYDEKAIATTDELAETCVSMYVYMLVNECDLEYRSGGREGGLWEVVGYLSALRPVRFLRAGF